MRESARAGQSWTRANATRLGIPREEFEKNTMHIHVPAGTIPKDGPSAGVTMATALGTDPSLLLLDEVAAGLNPSEIEEIMSSIKHVHYELVLP